MEREGTGVPHGHFRDLSGQSSKSSEGLREADPDNRLLARQAAVRLDAEFVRDNALAVSGLLVDRLGGRSAKPYQPAGYYSQLNFPKREYEADSGENQYRRGLYTHWQRTFLHPSLAGVRRAHPRGVHGGTRSLQYPATGVGFAQRPDLCRGGPRALRSGY